LMVFAHILVFGDKIGGKIFLFPFFQGDFLNFFGRISILCFCATISTYQQIISQNNRKKWQIAKKKFKAQFSSSPPNS
jgi:hypothetical protein